MVQFLKKQWFFVGIAVVCLLAFAYPPAGLFVREYKILKIGIFLAFLTTGLTLDTASIPEQLKDVKVLAAALGSSLILFPILAYFLARLCFDAHPDYVIGVLLMAAAPVTVASGTVMTGLARGNIPLSLFICVLGNFGAIITMPFMLNILLGMDGDIQLPVAKMVFGLVMTVLVPTVIGQLLRPKLKESIQPYRKAFSIFAQLIVLLIIFNAVSSSTSKLAQAGMVMVFVFLFMASLHVGYVFINRAIAKLIKLPLPSEAAFTIHTSQKTLTVTYLVWAGYFAADHPMALIPPIAYHLSQMIFDTMVAQNYRKKADRQD